MKHRILFCNIAYMLYYDYELYEERPKHGGLYVTVTGDALEKYNFHRCDDGVVRGFVETKYRDSYVAAKLPNNIGIQNIDKAYKNASCVDNVTIVFCAHSDICGKSVIVGWYRNATVYRQRGTYKGRQYNLSCDAENAHLLPENERTFVVPRASATGSPYGFGQANLWYAKEERSADYVESVLKYIGVHDKDSAQEDEDVMPQLVPQKYIESGIGKRVTVNRYERNPIARRKCLEISGARCVVCGFDSEKVYGDNFKNRIEVHHIVPINQIPENYQVNPETDLVPVCPNCHMILHTKMADGKYPSVAFLRNLLASK